MKTKAFWHYLIYFSLILILTGCSNIPLIPSPTPTQVAPSLVAPTITTTPTQVALEAPTPTKLTIWLPPQFAPSQDNEAGILLQDRLDTFNQLNPNLAVDYRIKAETGPASLVESLYAASGVAPLVLPDLVLLSTADMQTAAEQSLIFPYPQGVPAEDDADWYNIALELSSYENQRFLLPLGANALVMVYNSELVESAPRDWNDLIIAGNIISFPIVDPQAIFTLAFYLANGGILEDAENNITLQTEPLISVLTTYKQAQAANILPPNATQIDSDESAWTKFNDTGRQLAITWSSRYFGQSDEILQATTLPTINGEPSTVVNGWGWAIASPDPNKQVAAIELAQFLSSAEFAGPWSQATYLLPLRPFALTYWENEAYQILASQLLPVAGNVPVPAVLNRVSSPITEAVLDVLTDVNSPEDAAQIAVNSLNN